MKRPGRRRKNVKSGNILPANFESKDCVDGCEWKAVVKPTGLKIVLHKIDSRNSALVCKQNGISPKKQDFKFLFPKLTLPKIDSFIAEEKFSVFSVNSDEDGHSFRQFFSSYSKSVINSPELPRSLITERIFSMNSLLEDKSYPQRQSRKVLKDVKNTSVDREVRKNVFHGFEQSNIGQENVPIASNFDPRSVTCPQICIRLPQLNENLYRRTVIEKKYVESSSTFSSNQESIESRFQSFEIRGINNEKLEKSSSEMIVRNFTQTRNEVEAPTQSKLLEISSLETAPKAKRSRKRKSRKGKNAQKDDRDEHQNKASRRKKTRSSSFASRQEAPEEDALQFFRSSSKPKDQCKAIPSPEILRNTFKRRMQKDNIVGTKIIRKEAALEIHSTTFEDREKDDSDPLESPSRLQQTEVRLNISTKTVHENNTELDEFLELRYSAIEETKSEPTSFNSRKRKWSETEYNSKKRPFDSYNGPASNDSNRRVVLLPRIELPQLAIEAPKNTETKIRQLIPKADSAPSFSYVTRNKAAAYKQPVQFIRIPWNKSNGVEILNTKPKVNEHCVQTKSEPKPNVEVKRKSSKRQPVNSYSCYRTRQKSAQSGEHVEFYQIPWKKTKGLETVQTNKSKKLSKKTAKKEDVNQFLDELPLKKRVELLKNKSKKANISQSFDVDGDVPFKGFEDEFSTTVVAPGTEATIKKKGILKRNETLASSTPFPESSRRKAIPSNVSFFDDVEAATGNDTLSPVKDHHDVDTINRVPNGFAIRSCSVVLNCLPNPTPSSPSKSKRLMTGSEARRRAESFNCSKKALEMKAKSNRSGSDYSDTSVKRSTRMKNKRINYRYSSQASGSSSEEEPQIVVNRSKITTPYVRIRKLNSDDITSYKITPLKEDRIPKKSKTADDYGIDDINTDDSTDDEEFPKKYIPQWAKDYKTQPQCQSYLDMDMLDDWMRPPKFKYSLRHVFFSIKSHTFT